MALLGPRQRIDLIARIGKHLQKQYTFEQVKHLLREYGAYVGEPEINSKAAYVEDQLGYADSEIVLRIGEDFGLIQPTIQPTVQDANRLWQRDGFRLFLSHSSAVKGGTAELSRELQKFGITGFVAHDSIEPGREWQTQIELALQTMDALAFIVTKDVKASAWCDQEVGWALGSGKLVVPIKTDAVPYGFVGRYQGVNGASRSKSEVAFDLACILASDEKTKGNALGIAMALAMAVRKEISADRVFKAISAVVDNGQVTSRLILAPLAKLLDEKLLSRPGVTDAFAEFLREQGLEDLALQAERGDIPF
jgi:hypothetical protein